MSPWIHPGVGLGYVYYSYYLQEPVRLFVGHRSTIPSLPSAPNFGTRKVSSLGWMYRCNINPALPIGGSCDHELSTESHT